ncbi:MAG: hypothetical protein KDC49_19810 [Saprospiraceae bacterium]|nr:hypothetical protein [Saprospiraceae bacterium]
MKSDKSKKKIAPKGQLEFENLKPKKKMSIDKKPKVSFKSPKFWDELDDDTSNYKIRGM